LGPFGQSPGENDRRLALMKAQMQARGRRPSDELERARLEHERLVRLKNAAFVWTLIVLAVAGAVTWLEGTELAVIVTVAMTAALLGVLASWRRSGE
jgi:Flp pilus assembly protein TadB